MRKRARSSEFSEINEAMHKWYIPPCVLEEHLSLRSSTVRESQGNRTALPCGRVQGLQWMDRKVEKTSQCEVCEDKWRISRCERGYSQVVERMSKWACWRLCSGGYLEPGWNRVFLESSSRTWLCPERRFMSWWQGNCDRYMEVS